MGQPTFLCIGAQKAGTTWLDKALRCHPDIGLPLVKEIHYFDSLYIEDLRGMHFRGFKKQIEKIQPNKTVNTLQKERFKLLSILSFWDYTDETYLSLFQNLEHQEIGEITPAYSALPEEGVKHIRDLLGDIKVICIFRNPVARAWSQFRMDYSNFLIQNPSEQEILSKIKNGHWLKKYCDPRTNYVQTVDLYEKYFDNLLWLSYDDLCNYPENFIVQICNFLNIEFNFKVFHNVLAKRFNAGVSLNVPEEIKNFLGLRYKEQELFLQQKFPAMGKLEL